MGGAVMTFLGWSGPSTSREIQPIFSHVQTSRPPSSAILAVPTMCWRGWSAIATEKGRKGDSVTLGPEAKQNGPPDRDRGGRVVSWGWRQRCQGLICKGAHWGSTPPVSTPLQKVVTGL